MTEEYVQAFVVVLEKDIDSEQAKFIQSLLQMVKGVLSAEPIESDIDAQVARERANKKWRDRPGAADAERLQPQTEPDLTLQKPTDRNHNGDDNFVELTVLLTDEAFESLEHASSTTGDTRTDVVNRALIMYAAIQDAAARGGGSVTFKSRRGEKHHAVIA